MLQGFGHGMAAGRRLVEVDTVPRDFRRYEDTAPRDDSAGEDFGDSWPECRRLLHSEGVAGDVEGEGRGLGDRADVGRSVRCEPYAAQLAQGGNLAGGVSPPSVGTRIRAKSMSGPSRSAVNWAVSLKSSPTASGTGDTACKRAKCPASSGARRSSTK